MISVNVKSKHKLKNTSRYLKAVSNLEVQQLFNKYGEMGVNILSTSTPVDSGKTASSWYYKVEKHGSSRSLVFLNSNVVQGNNVALLLQFGHGTGTGGYVKGTDYIDSNVKDLFEKMLDEMMKELRELNKKY